MAHFAQLNSENQVINVVVIGNEQCLDENGKESEQVGIDYCNSIFPNKKGRWIQTSYNNNFRVRYACFGYTYDETLDAFIPPKPHPSWIIDESTADWKAPIPKPPLTSPASPGDKFYEWDESTLSWIGKDIPNPNGTPPDGYGVEWNHNLNCWELVEIS